MQHLWVQLAMSVIAMTLWIEGWYSHGALRPQDAYVWVSVITVTSFGFGLWAFIIGFKASMQVSLGQLLQQCIGSDVAPARSSPLLAPSSPCLTPACSLYSSILSPHPDSPLISPQSSP